MKVVTVGAASYGRYRGYHGRSKGRACKLCQRVLREGQRVLLASQYDFAHVACLRGLLIDEPAFMEASVVEEEFDAIRRELIEANRGRP